MIVLNVLNGCEYSGRVRDEFIARGHKAMSCDLLPTRAPGPHYQGDLLDIIYRGGYDLLIAHPPCTWLCSSGLHWNGRGRQGLTPEQCEAETDKALEFVCALLNAPIRLKCIENPIGCITTRIMKGDDGRWIVVPKGTTIPKNRRVNYQIIQPHWFGEDASKATVLILDGLMPLRETCRVPGRMVEWPRGSGKMVERWANQTDSGQNNLPPSEDRWSDRSLTYLGIARAMAEQWG